MGTDSDVGLKMPEREGWFPVSTDSDVGLKMPEREGWFSVGTDSPVGVKLMMEPARLVPRRAVEKLGVVTNTVCCLTWRP